MRYAHWDEDLLAIRSLLEAGRISYEEAAELRQYVEALAAESA